ncbi:synaptonemal complex central element protein 3 isoform X1 [Carassius auratus]|uniref:Synaptonemal complex central element protein 3 isoform X1 n=1 Tax=Carassius auratus TaxID=7957 RepID=A0A6P6L8W0_CARAU|nr:synaptonemal complex central element protein 3-like isoform X1 [Carassius auratus]XP_052471523.1 synaptonemal complex central element protein 3-like [Carassius gibelio]
MSDDNSSVQLCEDISRKSLQLNQHLEKMTEQMENVSVKLSWMAYDMVVLRTSPDLAESFKRLENEFLKCKAVICGPTDGQDQKCQPATERT